MRIKYKNHKVRARKTVIDYVTNDLMVSDIRAKLAQDPQDWIDELHTIESILLGHPSGSISGLEPTPPLEDPSMEKINDTTYFYWGDNRRQCGIWTSKETEGYDFSQGSKSMQTQWSLHRLGSVGNLYVNDEFSEIHFEDLLPHSFVKAENRLDEGTRLNKYYFKAILNGQKVSIFAKGTRDGASFFTQRPRGRLTNLAGVHREPAIKEIEKTLELEIFGIKVPEIVGYYESATEQFALFREVKGTDPLKYVNTYRSSILRQDARMLAALCLAGCRKQGFTDSQDKIFDGANLYLIDVDEVIDLYAFPGTSIDYREILKHPKDPLAVLEFRDFQRSIYLSVLKDALYDYTGSEFGRRLLRTREDREEYIWHFYDRLRWNDPTREEIDKILTVEQNHTTHDSAMSMMLDSD